ncbi:MAG: CvpA family protein [Bacteroidia bacterium]|nr:CvpA family protein [Bacteroidia bacterium]
MGTLDIIILAIIAAYAIWGLYKGFISQIVSILAIIAGVWCAFKFSAFLGVHLKDWFSLTWEQSSINIAAFAIILVFVIIISNIIGKGIEKIFSFALLGWLNRLLGFVFAAFKVTLILSLLTTLITKINNHADLVPKEYFNNSQTFEWLNSFADKIFPYLDKFFS